MKALFDQTAHICSRSMTELYSTSFSLGIKTLHKRFRGPIYAIYGFVRLADEIVDTFYDQPQEELLSELEEETFRCIERGFSTNPVLHGFQQVAREYGIDHGHIRAFLESMRMDLHRQQYQPQQYRQYIHGSAEVVGLMCLKVFCHGYPQQYERLQDPALRLGAAFQKVNFLRDLKEDFALRGRTYFPGLDLNHFDHQSKAAIEAEIEEDFKVARKGILQLPVGARLGVYLAYLYYQKLFNKIRESTPELVMEQRIRVPNQQKFFLLAQAFAQDKMGFIPWRGSR